jgi:hypothetical protein
MHKSIFTRFNIQFNHEYPVYLYNAYTYFLVIGGKLANKQAKYAIKKMRDNRFKS